MGVGAEKPYAALQVLTGALDKFFNWLPQAQCCGAQFQLPPTTQTYPYEPWLGFKPSSLPSASGKATEDTPNMWVPATHAENQTEFQAPDPDSLAQPWLSQPFGK